MATINCPPIDHCRLARDGRTYFRVLRERARTPEGKAAFERRYWELQAVPANGGYYYNGEADELRELAELLGKDPEAIDRDRRNLVTYARLMKARAAVGLNPDEQLRKSGEQIAKLADEAEALQAKLKEVTDKLSSLSGSRGYLEQRMDDLLRLEAEFRAADAVLPDFALAMVKPG